ncbi:hypothetical protein J1N35_003883 [Gossypium stocksii]|uniref:Uncharacterized protein n=1 Tax=Gossypium stocksii TaxID=47602 RepID=A0A9D4AHH7_9ROSI|nr:hypothetical protein J1N35_003883 [Gossypium stocksii]
MVLRCNNNGVFPSGKDDESKIPDNDAVCPVCDQVLSKSLMKPVDINPNDEWIKAKGIRNSVQDGENRSVLAKMRGNERKVLRETGADWSIFSPGTPGPREDVWPARQNSSASSPF